MARLNFEQIRRIRMTEAETEEEILKPLLTLFEKRIENISQEFLTHYKQNEFHEIAALAHSLKAAAGNLGLSDTEMICLRLETEAKRRGHVSPQDFEEIQAVAHSETEMLVIFNVLHNEKTYRCLVTQLSRTHDIGLTIMQRKIS